MLFYLRYLEQMKKNFYIDMLQFFTRQYYWQNHLILFNVITTTFNLSYKLRVCMATLNHKIGYCGLSMVRTKDILTNEIRYYLSWDLRSTNKDLLLCHMTNDRLCCHVTRDQPIRLKKILSNRTFRKSTKPNKSASSWGHGW